MVNNTVYLDDGSHPFSPYKKWENVTIVDVPIVVKSVLFAPYVYKGRFVEMLDTIKHWKRSKAIFAHQEFRNAKMGAFPSQDGDKWDAKWPLVISGHIHDYCELQDNIIYVGAAMQHTFTENGKKTICIITFEGSQGYSCERIELNIPKKLTYNVSVDDADLVLETQDNDVRVIVEGTVLEHLKWKKSKACERLKKNNVKIVYKQTDIEVIENVGSDLPTFAEILKRLVADESVEVQEMYNYLKK